MKSKDLMRQRIDILLVEKGLVETRAKAQWLIKKGYVLINKKKVIKPSKRIEKSFEICLIKDFPYVGRGGMKLEKALKDFSININKKICVDIGASIGGFTDCLLKKGALKVYAIDTATNLLHPSLSNKVSEEKIIPILGFDARNSIPINELVDLCTIDVTFTSLQEVLPNVRELLKQNGDIIALVKPIFEIDFYKEGKFKKINKTNHLFEILTNLIQWIIDNHFFLHGIIKSPLLGKRGSKEFFLHLRLKRSNLDLNYKEMLRDILN